MMVYDKFAAINESYLFPPEVLEALEAALGITALLERVQILETPGSMIIWPGTGTPSGYFLCDGSLKVRAEEAALFAAIGTVHNTGGETAEQFRLPNMKGRVPVGVDGSQAEFDTLGEAVGLKTAPLELLQHNHGGATHGHSVDHSHHMPHDHDGATAGFWHPTADSPLRTAQDYGGPSQVNILGYVTMTAAAIGIDTAPYDGNTEGASVDHSHALDNAGTTTPTVGNNIQPSRAVHYIIKY